MVLTGVIALGQASVNYFSNEINVFCHLTWTGFELLHNCCFRAVGLEDGGRVGGGETADPWPAAGRSSDCRVQQGDAELDLNSPLSVEMKLWRHEQSLLDFLMVLNNLSFWRIPWSQDPQPVAAHCFKEGMKLEAVDPAAPISIRPATVTKVTHFPIKGLPWVPVILFQLALLPCFYVLMSAQSTSVVAELLLHFRFICTFY